MIFVTVGTHRFDELVRSVDEAAADGCFDCNVVAQIGHGEYEPLFCGSFRMAPNLDVYYDHARLVVGHGGTGTTLEILSRGLRLVSVANPRMQDNHQHELLEALSERGLVRYCRDLANLREMTAAALREPPPQPVSFDHLFNYISRSLNEYSPQSRRR